jgi:hypothetical protein
MLDSVRAFTQTESRLDAQLWREVLYSLTCTECTKTRLGQGWKTNPDLNKAFSPFHLVAAFKE